EVAAAGKVSRQAALELRQGGLVEMAPVGAGGLAPEVVAGQGPFEPAVPGEAEELEELGEALPGVVEDVLVADFQPTLRGKLRSGVVEGVHEHLPGDAGQHGEGPARGFPLRLVGGGEGPPRPVPRAPVAEPPV